MLLPSKQGIKCFKYGVFNLWYIKCRKKIKILKFYSNLYIHFGFFFKVRMISILSFFIKVFLKLKKDVKILEMLWELIKISSLPKIVNIFCVIGDF